jgi:hypothetical protein
MYLAAIGHIQMHRHRRRAFPPSVRNKRLPHPQDYLLILNPPMNFLNIQDAQKSPFPRFVARASACSRGFSLGLLNDPFQLTRTKSSSCHPH